MGKGKVKQRASVQSATPQETIPWPDHPSTGNALTIASAVVLQFVIILLPLVGPTGSAAPHAVANGFAWVTVLLISILLSALALYSKLKRRAVDGSRFPIVSALLFGVGVLLLFALLTGMLRV